MSKTVSKAELARRLGVHRSTVAGYVRNGLPVQPDGRVDPAAAADWITRNIHAQAGARGAGVRGAAELADDPEVPPQTNGTKNGHPKSADLLEQSVRLTAARAQNIELRNAQLAGGTAEEHQRILANTIAINCWWVFQKLSPWTLEQTIADLSGVKDPELRYLIRDYILGRDEELARRLRKIIADGVGGRLPLVRGGELQGPPWVEPKTQRNPKSDAVTARAKMADEAV